jgi:hypothetical protein
MRPDRVVIGPEPEHAREVLHRPHRPLHLIDAPILFTGTETPEPIKYAANAFLAMKLTFINEMIDLCEKAGTGALCGHTFSAASISAININKALDERLFAFASRRLEQVECHIDQAIPIYQPSVTFAYTSR